MHRPPDLGSPKSINAEGGFYEHGKEYSFAKKWQVASVFFGYGMQTSLLNQQLTYMRELGCKSNVSAGYAKKVVHELTTMGRLQNPCATKLEKTSLAVSVLTSPSRKKCLY
jgi:hypothetical protein